MLRDLSKAFFAFSMSHGFTRVL